MGNDTTRRDFLATSLAVGAVLTVPNIGAAAEQAMGTPPIFDLDELTISLLQGGMNSRRYSAQSLTQKYLQRISELDKHGPAVNSVIETNPEAANIANALDRELKAKGPRGPLHGIPVLIKDNI